MTDEERDQIRKNQCDQLIMTVAKVMGEQVGASLPMILDRMITFSAAQACCVDGSLKTAASFRILADRIEAGAFHRLTGENIKAGERH